jgi:hypothetical protein
MNKKTIYILITICGLTWLLTSCAGTPAEPVTLEPTNTPLSSSSPVPLTETAAPTQTATPEPNETPLPTATSTQTWPVREGGTSSNRDAILFYEAGTDRSCLRNAG